MTARRSGFARLSEKLGRRLSLSLSPQERLFDGHDNLFREALKSCTLYGEYGMGASTGWVLRNTDAAVISVDTSREWVERVAKENDRPERLDCRWIDVGPVGNWGRPLSYARRDHFFEYVHALWDSGRSPDVVLIDGRFRVCCFLHSVLCARAGTRILFDDYVNRPHYHIVEEVVEPVRSAGRQAEFIVPDTMDRALAEDLRNRFLYVFD